ncbi:MAG: DUF4838 domain-containing protein [Fimbriimonadia bacterium]|nr:DUF4838 domain-containing protein [Fimbriimonadia bacterium]
MIWMLLPWTLEMNAPQKMMTLAENGKSDYAIVRPAQAIPSEMHAAQELQAFLKQISGAELPILTDAQPMPKRALLLGSQDTNAHIKKLRVNLPLKELGEDGIVIRSSGDHLILGGGRPRGTLYAVYTFLEETLGCRWYTSDESFIPSKRAIRIPAPNKKSVPAFEYREPFFTEAWETNWAARNRCNGHHMRLDETTGGKIGFYPFVHSFYTILPPDQYFKDHPEYYSLLKGERKVEGGQLCLTNPDVLRITIERVREWIRDHPEAKLFSVSQNDWYGCCECPACQSVIKVEGSAAGLMLAFVNAVAEAIEKDHPDKLIETLAYQWTEDTPATVKPRKNVRVRMAPIGNCFAHPIDTCPENKKPYENLLAWSRVTDNLYIWHYNTNFAHYHLPFPDLDELQGSNRAYHAMKVKGIFYQGAYPRGGGGEFATLRAWVLSKMLWNPKVDVWQLTEEFLNAYYGKAGPLMLQYQRMMHEKVQRENIHFRIFDDPKRVGYLPREILDRAESLFQQAEEAVANDPKRLERVQKTRLSIEYAKLMRAETDEERAKYAKIVGDKIKRFQIQQVNEWRPVEEFLKAIGQE